MLMSIAQRPPQSTSSTCRPAHQQPGVNSSSHQANKQMKRCKLLCTHLFLELHVDQVWLSAIALPIRVLPPIPQQLHSIARLGGCDAPHRQLPYFSCAGVGLQHRHHCRRAGTAAAGERRRQRAERSAAAARPGNPLPFIVVKLRC